MDWTIPNVLTVGRIAAAPLIAFAFLVADRPYADAAAFLIFVAAALTDFFDGALARRYGQVSAFGRMLDPIADKAMVSITGMVLAALYQLAALVLIPVTVMLLRETLVSGLREFLRGADVVKVTLLAKWKTTAQMVAMAALLLVAPLGAWGDIVAFETVSLALLWVAALMTAITGWDYFAKGMAHLRAGQGRAARESPKGGEARG